MINQTIKKNLITIIISSLLSASPTIMHGNQTKFELKKSTPTAAMEAKEKPLFDLLNTPIQPQNQSSENKWDNNPFFKQQKKAPLPEPTQPQATPQPMNLYEYKITAIWTVNDTYKALVSGHIVKKGDQINEIKIEKITKRDITVKRKNKRKTFRLGSIFYDFQI